MADDQSDNETNNQVNFPTPKNINFPTSISLYTLRYANRNDNWNIQAIFADGIKFNFTQHTIPTDQKVNSTIFSLHLNTCFYRQINIFL